MNGKLKIFLNKVNSSYRFTKKMYNEAETIKNFILEVNSTSSNLEELLYLINNSFKEPLSCPICNQPRKFLTYKRGYNLTCGNRCCVDKIGKINRDKTILDKYGIINTFQNENIKEKIKQTNLERYGTSNPMQLGEIKEKIKQTNLEKYGVENVSQSKDIQKRKEVTSLKNFGVKYHSELQEQKVKLSKIAIENFQENGDDILSKRVVTNLDKYGVESAMQLNETIEKAKVTNLDRYGEEFPSQSDKIKDKIKQTNLKKYGVEYAMQNPIIFDRQQKSSYKLKEYVFPSGRIEKIQGYEDRGLDLLLENYKDADIIINNTEISKCIGKIEYSYQGKSHTYYPDIYIKSINKVIEVKSEYTYNKDRTRNIKKMESVLKKQIKFEFQIFNENGELLQLDANFKIKRS